MKKIVFLLCFLIVMSCQRSPMMEESNAGFADMKRQVSQSAFDANISKNQSNTEVAVGERMLIKTGNLTMQVDNVKQSRKQIGDIANKFKAYISDERLEDYGDRLNTSLTIRVPSISYDTLILLIEQVGEKTDSKSVNVQDVTEEYIDVEARLKTKKELEARYREILKQANTVTDILSVESNLNSVRAEIESMEGRLKYLMSQISFSTLNLNFYQKISADYGFGDKFADGLGNGWTNFLGFFIGLANIWPFLILIGSVVWLFIRWKRRRKPIQ
jgi:Domain of unknown function (DUF4349)